MKQGKIWGETQCIFDQNNVSIHRITANKNSKCSKHYHSHRYNLFFIEKGVMMIEIWQTDYDLVDTTILKSGESTIIKPGLSHRFTALEDTVAYEIYYVVLDNNDITRENCGSK